VNTIELWHEVEIGSWSVADQIDRDDRRFLHLRENTPRDVTRALTDRERDVVARASRGDSNKVVAYDLGIGVSTVSTHLSNAAAKLGLRSRTAIIQVYCALGRADATVAVGTAVLSFAIGPRLPDILSVAEREVVALVVAGMSNETVARARQVSASTVANQLAAVMRKLAVGSRADLTAQVMRAA
jgi:DNA-binding CsgD family transcriptional regulator